MRTPARFALYAFVLAALPAVAQAPREGPVDMTFCFAGPTHTVEATEADQFGTYALNGGTQAADKQFHALGFECVGTFEYRSTVQQHRGYCVYRDTAGDTVYGVDMLTPQSGYVWEFLGGTGKFKGIQGSGKVERTGAVAQMRKGLMQGCRRLTGTYKLP
jgi:hypothetical protein